MEDHSSSSLSTLSLHTPAPEHSWAGGHQRHLAPPITLAATFQLPSGCEVEGEPVYGRYGHPSRCHLETVLASLESATHCLCFSSGMAAAHTVLQTLVPGDHVVAGNCLYGGVLSLIRQSRDLGVNVTFVPTEDPDKLGEVIRDNTKIVWLEICSNPSLKILDLKKTVQAVKSINAETKIVVDNTFLTPWVIKPLDHGVDIVMHSVTKYINGHSDVIMGCLAFNSDQLQSELYKIQKYRGATPSPFDCYLVLRSLATLELRMERHMRSCVSVAQYLSCDPRILSVVHPLLSSHPQHTLTLEQHQARHSGMLSFTLTHPDQAPVFLNHLTLIKNAASLGSSHSLACQPARLTHAMCTPEEREAAGVTDGLIRLSVGLEDPEDIIKDIVQALDKV